MKLSVKHRFLATIILIISAVLAFFNVLMPVLFKEIVDNLSSIATWTKYMSLYVGAVGVILLIEYGRKILASKYRNSLLEGFRSAILEANLSKKPKQYNKIKPQERISSINNDLPIVVDDYYLEINEIIFQIVSILIGCFTLSKIYWPLAIISVMSSASIVVIPMLFKRKLSKMKQRKTDSLKGYNVSISDAFEGYEEIKIYNMKNVIKQIVNNKSLINLRDEFSFQKNKSLSEVIIGAVSFSASILIILLGGYQVYLGAMTIGSLFAAIQLSETLVDPIIGISISLNTVLSTTGIKHSLFEDLEVANGDDGGAVDDLKSISIRNVSVEYGDKTILKDFSYDFLQGKKYLIKGANGSGKSTLIKMIQNSVDQDSQNGEILINETDRTRIADSSFFEKIAFIPQTPYVFGGTVEDNVSCFGKNQIVESEALEKWFKKGNMEIALREKRELRNDIENISGGEKEKIAIMRALSTKATWIVMDEATSAMDSSSRRFIEDYLTNREDLTLIEVAHNTRGITESKYDEIIELGRE